jgi:hypothetical protein
MRFTSLLPVFLSSVLVSSLAISRTGVPQISAAITAVSDAVTAQNGVIAKFPEEATFADFDKAGDALTDALKDLYETIDKSKSLSRSDSSQIVKELVQVLPRISDTLALVVRKKKAFVKNGNGAAEHVEEELTDDQSNAKKVFEALQGKLTVTDPRKLITLGKDLSDEFKKAVAAYQ